MKSFGHFDSQDRFIIDDPFTPEAWLHYLIRPDRPGTETFCSGVSYSGGGFDIRGTHENTFVDTRLHLNDADDSGRYIYIVDQESGDAWTTSWQPIKPAMQQYKATLGFGYIDFDSTYDGIHSEQTMFVPREFDGWVQRVHLKNESGRRRTLSIYPFVPIHMGDALVRLVAGDNDAFFGGAGYDHDLNAIVFRRHHGISVDDDPQKINGMLGNVAAYHCTLNTDKNEYETSIERFVGNRFRNLSSPEALSKGKLSCLDLPHLRRACGIFRNQVILEADGHIDFSVCLVSGSTNDYYRNKKKELKEKLELVRNPELNESMKDSVVERWKEMLGGLRVKSPDEKLNRAFRWLQYQCRIVYALNRMKSRYHTGYEYGWGFRDILQDVLFHLSYDPEMVKNSLKHIATQIFSSGACYHNFFIHQPGNKSVEASDDPLWFVNAIVAYCKESGDFAFLGETADYADIKEGNEGVRGTILEHCVKAVERVWADRSARSLPFMKDCDWNDDLNLARQNGKPNRSMESVMVAQQLYRVLLDFAVLLDAAALEPSRSREYRDRAHALNGAIKAHAMDREGYFKRALSVDGSQEDLGTSSAQFAKIFLEPQAFGVLCGVTDPGETEAVLAAVETHLDTEFGALLCFPYFTDLSRKEKLPVRTWNIEKEPPGMKENGSIFMHLNAWLVQAYCHAGKGNKAVEHYLKNLPENMSADQARYMAEPYVYPEYVVGRDVEHFGRGGHTWLTGTAPTMHQALTEFIFGLKADYDGLRIDPCVHASWKDFSIERNFRGARYSIHASNPDGVEHGVKAVTVDGKSIDGNMLPLFGDGREHRVDVTMGKII